MSLILKKDSDHLEHHGIKGQKHGHRRWQNEDGSYTSEGYQHYKEMYGWGEKKKAKTEKTNEELHSESKKDSATSKRLLQVSANLGKGSATTLATTAGLLYGSKPLADMAYKAANIVDAATKGLDMSNLSSKILNPGTSSILKTAGNELSKLNPTMVNSIGQVVGDIGVYSTVAIGIGALSVAGVAAFYKIRSSLKKKKLRDNVMQEYAPDLAHADAETMADIFDTMDDKQKFYVLFLIDQVVTGKITVRNGKVTINK